jgi:hypothetical protein
MASNDADETKKCRYVFPDGVRCANKASQSGFCQGHPPDGGKNRAAWVSAISAAISATTATITVITVAWPHLQPLLHTWLQNHAGFMSRAEILVRDVLKTGDDFADNASIQKQIDLLLGEAAELHRAVYASQPVSGGTPQKSAA